MTGENVQQPGIFGRYLQPYTDEFYLLFRLVFATLVGLHGAQKAFLLWNFPAGANPNGLGTLVDIAGWVELIAALLIGLGVLTRLGAGALAVMMIVAYFGVHAALSTAARLPSSGSSAQASSESSAAASGVLRGISSAKSVCKNPPAILV